MSSRTRTKYILIDGTMRPLFWPPTSSLCPLLWPSTSLSVFMNEYIWEAEANTIQMSYPEQWLPNPTGHQHLAQSLFQSVPGGLVALSGWEALPRHLTTWLLSHPQKFLPSLVCVLDSPKSSKTHFRITTLTLPFGKLYLQSTAVGIQGTTCKWYTSSPLVLKVKPGKTGPG